MESEKIIKLGIRISFKLVMFELKQCLNKEAVRNLLAEHYRVRFHIILTGKVEREVIQF